MIINRDQINFLHQADWKQSIDQLGSDQWLPVYRSIHTDEVSVVFFCALIPVDHVDKALSNPSWDLMIDHGRPGCSVRYEGEREIVEYHRFGDDNGIEPFVIRRRFNGTKPAYLEICEEFRLLHDLYHDAEKNEFVRINDAGDDEVVVKIEPDSVKVRQKEVRQFLALKEMYLAVFFDVVHFSTLPPSGMKLEETEIEDRDRLLRYSFRIDVHTWKMKLFSHLMGKKLIAPYPKESCGIWPYEQPEQYEDFIIDADADSKPVTYSCNPDDLANSFGANPGSPHYLTPVFFRQEVLEKYYASPEKYTVSDNHLMRNGLWSLRMDNNHRDYVIVFLGDLGRDIPHREQVYWRSFNVPPQGGLSSVSQKRYIHGMFTDPEKADFLFKYMYEEFQKDWEKKFGWPLFLPLDEKDQYLFTTLRIPLSNDQAAFDPQILALTKVLIDSLNEKGIELAMGEKCPDQKGISKLEAFLYAYSFSETEKHIKFLRNLQELRSTGSGHRKGTKYTKISAEFGISQKEPRIVFEEILINATDFLKALSGHRLRED